MKFMYRLPVQIRKQIKIKPTVLTIIGVLLFTGSFSQFIKAPGDMQFVPSGSFTMTTVENKDTIHRIISVQSFYMSDEITNKQYREFVNFILDHPGDSLCYIDYERVAKDKADNNKFDHNKYLICARNAEISKHIMDTSVWGNMFTDDKPMQEKYRHYFTDKAFDDYPVVGVSYKNALLYCIWKTKLENEKMRKKGEPFINDYRLPTEWEWIYAASQGRNDKVKNDGKICPVNKMKEGTYGLHNLSGNVSEWTSTPASTNDPDLRIIRGGSWRSGQNISPDERKTMDQGTGTCYIGFRIIRTFLDNDR
jgi:formylglycine-generating enzyme required for sulfatase activity